MKNTLNHLKTQSSLLAFAAIFTASALQGQVTAVFTEDFSLNKNGQEVADGTLVYSLFTNLEGTGLTVGDPGVSQQLTVSTTAPANGFSADDNFAIRHLDGQTGIGNLRLRTYNTAFTDEEITTITFDYHPVAYGNQGMRFLVATADGVLNQLNFALHTATGAVQNGYEAQGEPLTEDGFIQLGGWYRYELVVNTGNQTYSVKIWEDGTANPILNVGGLTFVNPISGIIGRVEWQPFGNNDCIGLEAYIDNVRITQGVQSGTIWAGFPIVEGGYVDTGDFMGWLYVGSAPWIWSANEGKYIYLPESNVIASGAWSFTPR